MLLGQNLGWRHDGRLHAAGDGFQAGNRGDDGLAGADVALDQAHHRVRLRQVRENFIDDALLRAGELEKADRR